MAAMKLGSRGIALIRGDEKLRLKAYLPTMNDRWTCGWGHTRGVTASTTCTPEIAEQWFHEDTAEAVRGVLAIKVPLSQSMFDALVSLAFNAGEAVAPGNTICDALREGRYYAAWRGMALWTKQAGKDLRGLAARRAREMELFMADPFP